MLLAVPRNEAIVLTDKEESILHTRGNGVLAALQRVRKAEAATASTERLRELDNCIQAQKKRKR